MKKFLVIFILILLSIINVICQDPSSSTPEPKISSTTDDPNITSSTFKSSKWTSSTISVSNSTNVCSGNHSYKVPLIKLPRKAIFRFPVIFIGIELLVLFIIRGIIAVYVYRRRLRKIFIFTHPPILDEHYFDDPPPYAITNPE